MVSLSGECGSGVMLAQVDSKINDQQRIAWLSVESIHSHEHPHLHERNTLLRLVIENDKGGWREDSEHTSKRP